MLRNGGYDVLQAYDGVAALEIISCSEPDLCILDLMLPLMNGFEVLRRMREKGIEIPIIVLSARGETADRITAFRLGADDYVVKPFSVIELLERVKANLRRCRVTSGHRILRIGETLINPDSRTAISGTRESRLRPKEIALLRTLLSAKGTIVEKHRLLQTIWNFKGATATRTVDFHVSTLRGKIEVDPAKPRHLLTVRGVGYRLVV